jgi:hypothetical protein
MLEASAASTCVCSLVEGLYPRAHTHCDSVHVLWYDIAGSFVLSCRTARHELDAGTVVYTLVVRGAGVANPQSCRLALKHMLPDMEMTHLRTLCSSGWGCVLVSVLVNLQSTHIN